VLPRVAFRTLGCKVNQVESEAAAASLLAVGAEVVPEADAELVVINTCTVTGEADAKARKAVRHALRLPRRPIVVVTGCLASLDAAGLRALDERVVVEADKMALAARIADLIGAAAPPASGSAGGVLRTRAMLKVEDGCDAFCTYCIVPYARGVPRATPLPELIAEAERLVASGVAEIVLTGVNIGRYRDDDVDFAALVQRIAATGVPRLRISSIEPLDLDDRLLGVLAATPSVQPHLHIPLQAGSDRVLAAMGRGYDTATYAARVDAVRSAVSSFRFCSAGKKPGRIAFTRTLDGANSRPRNCVMLFTPALVPA
jgi:threonylcarbamoyladenosine tRNA methylthiotransferase MtaB